jgi:hypothetical protein
LDSLPEKPAGSFEARRIHLDGFQMLDVKYSEQETKSKLDAVSNRLNRLEFEEKRAQRLAELADKRAGDLIESRKRHF